MKLYTSKLIFRNLKLQKGLNDCMATLFTCCSPAVRPQGSGHDYNKSIVVLFYTCTCHLHQFLTLTCFYPEVIESFNYLCTCIYKSTILIQAWLNRSKEVNKHLCLKAHTLQIARELFRNV